MAEDGDSDDAYETVYDTDQDQPNVDVTETIAELKGVESDELSPLYDAIDHVIDNVFSNPPEPAAAVEVSFSYEGFRITIQQNGHARFRPL